MKSSMLAKRPERLSESQCMALVKLLADDDPEVCRLVWNTILAQGPDAAEWLKKYRLADDTVMRRRVNGLLNHFARQEADTRLLAFCLRHGEDLGLEEAAWLLATSTYPDISVAGYQALLDVHADNLRERTSGVRDSKRLLGTINRYLFKELEFHGNEQDYYDPDNSYLNSVLDRRTGNPISLCLVYLFLCRRLKLPVVGIGLPGHFLCRYQTSSREFYIDVFRGGLLLTKADCIHYLVHSNYSLREEYFGPMSNRRILMRVIGNLNQIYQQLGKEAEASRMRGYLLALAKERASSKPCPI